jgi:hypothetical protein
VKGTPHEEGRHGKQRIAQRLQAGSGRQRVAQHAYGERAETRTDEVDNKYQNGRGKRTGLWIDSVLHQRQCRADIGSGQHTCAGQCDKPHAWVIDQQRGEPKRRHRQLTGRAHA